MAFKSALRSLQAERRRRASLAGVTLVGLADNYHAAASSHDGLECL